MKSQERFVNTQEQVIAFYMHISFLIPNSSLIMHLCLCTRDVVKLTVCLSIPTVTTRVTNSF